VVCNFNIRNTPLDIQPIFYNLWNALLNQVDVCKSPEVQHIFTMVLKQIYGLYIALYELNNKLYSQCTVISVSTKNLSALVQALKV
jgi:hypothetical protein